MRKIENGSHELSFVDRMHPLKQGFGYYFGFDAAETTYYDSPLLWRNDTFGAEPVGYLTEQLTNEAIKFIDASGKEPFFLYLAYNAPHEPITTPPQQYLAGFETTGNRAIDDTIGTIRAMDKGIGDVLEHLKKSGIEENTLVIFASDNGATFNSPLPSNGDLRGYKRNYYEGGIRVPLIAYWPGRIAAAKIESQTISVMDIMPTILDSAGVGVPQSLELDGKSVLDVICEGGGDDERILCWAGPNGRYGMKLGNYKAIAKERSVSVWDVLPIGWYCRKGQWKLVDPSSGLLELYNLSNDIAEENNIIEQYPEKAAELKKIFTKWLMQMQPPKECEIQGWERLRLSLTADNN
jgi:uncharacterized sulfatase